MPGTVGVNHPLDSPLAPSAQIEVVLEQLAEKLSTINGQTLLQLDMAQPAGLLTPQEPRQTPVEHIGSSEAADKRRDRGVARLVAVNQPSRAASINDLPNVWEYLATTAT